MIAFFYGMKPLTPQCSGTGVGQRTCIQAGEMAGVHRVFTVLDITSILFTCENSMQCSCVSVATCTLYVHVHSLSVVCDQ